MDNIFRFIIGLIVFFIILATGGIVAIIISPILIVGGILILLIFLVGFILALIIGSLSFIWYMSRSEPKKEQNTDFKMDQGKDV